MYLMERIFFCLTNSNISLKALKLVNLTKTKREESILIPNLYTQHPVPKQVLPLKVVYLGEPQDLEALLSSVLHGVFVIRGHGHQCVSVAIALYQILLVYLRLLLILHMVRPEGPGGEACVLGVHFLPALLELELFQPRVASYRNGNTANLQVHLKQRWKELGHNK